MSVGDVMGRGLVAAGFMLLAAIATLGAHHAITDVYDVSRTMTVEGRVDRLVFKDPHTFVHLQVTGDDGSLRTWAVELEGAAKLRRQGVRGDTLKAGDYLSICGNPGRDASQYRLRMLILTRAADGLVVEISPSAESLPEPGEGCADPSE